jgi:hypothetical protein
MSGVESQFAAQPEKVSTAVASFSMMDQARALRMEAEMLSISRSETIESLQVGLTKYQASL